MPPSYRDRPALEVALPGDSAPGLGHGWRDGHRHRWLILFGDGTEHPVSVLAWWADDRGREVVQVEFWDRGSMTTRESAYLVDAERMRDG